MSAHTGLHSEQLPERFNAAQTTQSPSGRLPTEDIISVDTGSSWAFKTPAIWF